MPKIVKSGRNRRLTPYSIPTHLERQMILKKRVKKQEVTIKKIRRHVLMSQLMIGAQRYNEDFQQGKLSLGTGELVTEVISHFRAQEEQSSCNYPSTMTSTSEQPCLEATYNAKQEAKLRMESTGCFGGFSFHVARVVAKTVHLSRLSEGTLYEVVKRKLNQVFNYTLSTNEYSRLTTSLKMKTKHLPLLGPGSRIHVLDPNVLKYLEL